MKQYGASATIIADRIGLSPGRVRMIIRQLELVAVDKIGNVPLYSGAQEKLIKSRNQKPGPQGKKRKGK